MSEITGKTFTEPFKMRVVSGMLVDGSIQVSWATGKKASSQMYWGLDPDNLATTPEYHREPAEMVRYHTLYFPITYLDTEHFFRVRSRTAAGKVGQSGVYSVIVPSKLRAGSELAAASVTLEIKPVGSRLVEQPLGLSGSHRADMDPEGEGQFGIQAELGEQPVEQAGPVESTNFTTNYNLTIS